MTTTTAPQPLSVLSEEEELFRQTVREFAETEIGPHVHDMDVAAEMRPDLIEKFFELGLMGIEVPEQYGGAGGTIFLATLAIEEMARVDASSAIYVDVHNTLVNNALMRWGTDEQKARYFPRMTTDLLGAFALSEPASGSDAFALEARATQDGDDWLITGRKFWITSGAEAGIFIVFATVDPALGYKGITAFLVETGLSRPRDRQAREEAGYPRIEHRRADPRGVPRPGGQRARPGWTRATRSRSRRSTRGESGSGRR